MAPTPESDTAYRDIFEASPDPIFVHHPDSGVVTAVNGAAADLLGTDRESIVGRGVGEFSPPEFTTEEANDLIRTAATEGQNSVEWQIESPDGEPKWVDVSMQRATVDGELRVVAYVRDVTTHRTVERQFQRERDLLDRLLDVTPVGIVIHGPDGTINKTNAKAESILGVERGELLGDAVSPDALTIESVEGDEPEAGGLPFESVARTGEAVHGREVVLRNGDGERLILSTSATPLFEDGDLSRVVVSVVDVTERRRRERSRREQAEQLRTLVDNLPVVVFTLDPEGVFTHSAGKGLASLGLEPGELEGVSVFDAYAEYDDIVEAAERALAGEEVRVTQQLEEFVFETWYKPVFEADGELSQVIGVARDVTELKRREQRVQRLSDATRDLQYAESESEVAEVVTGIAREIVGRPLAAIWSYDEADDTLYPVGATSEAAEFAEAGTPTQLPPMGPGTDEKAIFDAGEPAVIEDYRELDDPSAPGVPLGTLLCLPLDDHGLLCVGSPRVEEFDDTERHLIDILASTAAAALERVEREQSLRAYRDELERSNEALQQFAYVASHDLQEPLRMVSSYVDLLESEYGDQFDEEAAEYMEFAVDGARRMQSMIDGLLDYSRVETTASSFEPVDPTAVLEDTLAELSLFLDEAGVTVDYGEMPTLPADRAQLGQVFQNLLKNAVDHGDATEIEVDATTEDEHVEFAVSDDGVGIPADQQDRIFEIFKQGRAGGEGTGMGLAICQRIARRHGGTIRVESAPGEGTTFYVRLPRTKETNA